MDIYNATPIPSKYKHIQALNENAEQLLTNYELMDLMTYCDDAIGKENISDNEQPATGSEDFADMLKVVPGAYCRIGHSGTTGLHNPSFFLDPSILPVGASVMARIAERRLSE